MVESTYFRIFTVFILSLVFSLFRGKAIRVGRKVKRIGVLYQTSNLGDMVFCTPVFRALREGLPESEMHVIGRKRNEDTLRFNPDVSVYHVCPNSLWALFILIRSLKLEYVFLMNPSTLELGIFFLAGVPAIASFSAPDERAETRTYRILKKLCIRIPFTPGSNFALENLKLISPLGIMGTDTRKHLFFSEDAKKTIEIFFKTNEVELERDFVVAVAPGAGTKVKQWPAERFAKLADHLYEKYQVPIFVIGGPGDTAEFEAMSKAALPQTKIISCLHHSIDELKAFVSLVDLVIANDSAPIYIAETFDKGTVVIVGPTDENEHPPKGPYHRMVKSKDRGLPALRAWTRTTESNCTENPREQIERVTYEEVASVVDELIGRLMERKDDFKNKHTMVH